MDREIWAYDSPPIENGPVVETNPTTVARGKGEQVAKEMLKEAPSFTLDEFCRRLYGEKSSGKSKGSSLLKGVIRKGVVVRLRPGVYGVPGDKKRLVVKSLDNPNPQVKAKAKAKAPTTTHTIGALLEVLGYTQEKRLVVRSLDTGTIYLQREDS